MMFQPPSVRRWFARAALGLGAVALALVTPSAAFAAFGLTASTDFYTIDTDAGLVFKVRRTDNGSSTQSPGDLASLVYKGVEYQDQARGSQVNAGFDWLYTGVSAVTVSADTIGSDYVRVTVVAGDLTHYYVARRGDAAITMGTYFKTEPSVHNLCRYIVRIPSSLLPNGPVPSDIRNATHAVESQDVFGLPDGTTRSKHYSNLRLKDWAYIGATGNAVGVWMVRDNNEGNSGGPFYRCLLNQCGSDQEITYMINYGEIQTEAFRTNILNTYTLVFTDGTPPPPVDDRWLGQLGLTGFVGPEGRGSVAGIGITGRDARYEYTVGFANSTAQYWATAAATDGAFDCTGMLPGTYTMTVYKNELAVDVRAVTVAAGSTTALDTIAITRDPSTKHALWRIGDWDGTPREFLNGPRLTIMHPSDVRMSSWVTPPYVIGQSIADTGFPAYQWKGVNNPLTITFNLTADQIADYNLNVGITVAYLGGRPMAQVNAWNSPIPAAPTEPKTRSLTVGSYRGNNVTYSYHVPASALVVGQNTLKLTVVSGSSGTGFLSPGCAYDAVEWVRIDTVAPVLSLPAPIVAEATGPDGAMVHFTATATDDVDGPVPVTLSQTSGTMFPLGTTTVTATATDAAGNVATGTFTVTVRDTTPPPIHSVTASPDRLWPAQHQMVPVTVKVSATDLVSAVTSRIVSISSNEPIDGLGDGDTSPDWEQIGDLSVNLRAERSGNGNGRVYTMLVEARDAAGNASTAALTVAVPHDAAAK